ncbi:hypothetical protein [Enterococcus casseliflavus]|uniref:hypothetical protein n=1 Tax=Enterococcus casseliflavus TaxID=37734 RepID=UPI0003A01DEE|nr:hypothetical protein [Enterococcus casseliflavus]QQB84066.1 hypothetical protein I6H55_08945 [Enterococcus casseliflavus]
MNVSEEYKITTGTISGATLKSIDIEPSIIVDGKSYTASEFNKAVEMLKQPQLNENQQIVLEWLKKEYFQGYGPAIIRTIHLLQRENSIDISGSKPVTQAYRNLNTAEEAVVVKMFADWALEQEEE